MIRAVAWDVDGTLVDSEPAHHTALAAVSACYGVAIAADDRRFVGVAMEDVWTALAPLYPPTLSRQAWFDAIVDAYVERAPQLAPIAGAREAALALWRAGVPQGCVSNSARRIVEINLRAIGLAEAFAFAISREDVERGKPDPAPYALACRRFRLSPAEVLAVEDSDVGAASARRAGLKVTRVDVDDGAYRAVVDCVLRGRALA